MPKMSEGDMQEQAALDSIMAMRRKKKTVKKACGGKVHKMKSGGKVRGCGKAMKGTRKAKMY